MSIDPSRDIQTPCRKLNQYIRELVKRLGDNDPCSFIRMCEIVGNRKARIILGNESVTISLNTQGLTFYDDRGDIKVDGEGKTNRCTVIDLLDGYIEVSEAISNGSLQVIGDPDNVFRMLLSIEILLDCSVRIPTLQELARDYRNDPCQESIEEIIASGNSRRYPITTSSPLRRVNGNSSSNNWETASMAHPRCIEPLGCNDAIAGTTLSAPAPSRPPLAVRHWEGH